MSKIRIATVLGCYLSYLQFLVPAPSLLVLVAGIVFPEPASIILAASFGVMVDLTSGQLVGLRSIFYLVMTVVIILYRKKIAPTNPWYLGILAIVYASFEYYFIVRVQHLWAIIFSPLVVVFLLKIMRGSTRKFLTL